MVAEIRWLRSPTVIKRRKYLIRKNELSTNLLFASRPQRFIHKLTVVWLIMEVSKSIQQ